MKKMIALWIILAMIAMLGVAACADGDAAAAAAVDEMITAIQARTWTEDTDAQVAAARAGWDALTDAQKALVAQADYFSLDTGDAALDDPRNGDGIGEDELLVVSVGTAYNDSRAADIGGIEAALQEAYPDWSVRRAFISQAIINHIAARDGEQIDNVAQALDRAVANGVKRLIVQPTLLIKGAMYDELCQTLRGYEDRFDKVYVSQPLLGEVGQNAFIVNEDKRVVLKKAIIETRTIAGFEDSKKASDEGYAFVLVGRGTGHAADVSYEQINTQLVVLNTGNAFIGTLEGKAEGTECGAVIEKVKEAGFTKVILRPLMVVAGEYAHHAIADPGNENSWLSRFTADGSFESVDCQIEGLGRIEDIKARYVAHVATAIEFIG